MATKTTEELRRERTGLIAQKTGLEASLATDITEAERQELASILYECDSNIRQLDQAIDALEVKEEKTRKRSNWRSEQPAVDLAIAENHIGYLVNEDRFIYCKDFGAGQRNVQFRMINSIRIIRALNQMTGRSIQGRDHHEMIDYFQTTGRSYFDVTSSFNRSKWDERQIYNKMTVIQQHWIQPDFEHSADYDPAIDILVHCVAGGQQENIDHLERWVAFKYLNPGRNANTPNLDLGGNPGGNGKGRFVELLKTIFTPTCVVQAHREELDKFNANWEMAVILYYDEPEEKELAASKLKQATGAEDMRIEKKGIDATMADRNYNFVFLSNNPNGVVRLSGGSNGGEDRRYSVINTDLVLLDVIREMGEMTESAAQEFLDRLAQHVVKDKAGVARWLAHCIQKHQVQTMTVLPALHGADYLRRFEDQKDTITQAFDAVVGEFQQQGTMPLTVLTELVRAHTGSLLWKEAGVRARWEQYLKRNRIEAETLKNTRFRVLWRGDELKNKQGKIYVTAGSTATDWEYSGILARKPNYNGINVPIAKDDMLVG